MLNINNRSNSIANASVMLFIFGIFAKVIGLFREIIFANNFGLSKQFDLFLAVSSIPIVINTAFLYLSQHYFIPNYNKFNSIDRSETDQLSGEDFLNYTFWWFLIIASFLALILYFISGIILKFYLNPESEAFYEKGLKIFILFLITIPLNAGISVISSYMQANFNFIFPVVSQLILNIVLIVLTIFFTNLLEIFILPVSFAVAYLVVFLILVLPVFKKLIFKPSLLIKKSSLRLDLKILFALIFIEGLSLSYIIVDRYFMGVIPEGGIAALHYALILYLLPVTIFSLPLITTIFSKFSESVNKSIETVKDNFVDATRINVFIIIPSAIALYFGGDVFLKIFYERGNFNSADTMLTQHALKYYSISLLFYSTYLIAVKLLYSFNKYNEVLVISLAAIIIKILLNATLVFNLKQNGLALSTSIIYLFLFLIGYYLANKLLNQRNSFFHIKASFYFLFNGVLSYLIASFMITLLDTNNIIFQLIKFLIFILLYTFNASLINDKEYQIIKETLINFIPFSKLVRKL
jgi:putative peptidoglycan lipid II flippase